MGTTADAAREPTLLTRMLIGRNPKRTLVRVILIIAAALLIRAFALVPVRVEGISMLPTYKDRSFNIINRLSYLFHEPRRGDVVGIRLLAGGHVMYLKRIVGLPGETVSFHQGRLYINGQPLPEPYVKRRDDWEHGDEAVGPGEYYVVGDNRDMPWQYHEKGRLPRAQIVGKVML